jgi:hypothetical protein
LEEAVDLPSDRLLIIMMMISELQGIKIEEWWFSSRQRQELFPSFKVSRPAVVSTILPFNGYRALFSQDGQLTTRHHLVPSSRMSEVLPAL